MSIIVLTYGILGKFDWGSKGAFNSSSQLVDQPLSPNSSDCTDIIEELQLAKK
jgi:hypothetical protein